MDGTIKEVIKCPATYRYAFKNGKYCCQTNKDYNGGQLTESSRGCQYNAYRKCPGCKCKDAGMDSFSTYEVMDISLLLPNQTS